MSLLYKDVSVFFKYYKFKIVFLKSRIIMYGSGRPACTDAEFFIAGIDQAMCQMSVDMMNGTGLHLFRIAVIVFVHEQQQSFSMQAEVYLRSVQIFVEMPACDVAFLIDRDRFHNGQPPIQITCLFRISLGV